MGVAWLSFAAIVNAVMGLISLPFLTRMVGMEDIGFFQAYLATAVVISSIACLRLETSILADGSERSDVSITASLLIAMVLSLICGLAIPILLIFGVGEKWIYWLPISIMSSGVMLVAQSECLVKGKYITLALAKVISGAIYSILPLLLIVLDVSAKQSLIACAALAGVVFLPFVSWKRMHALPEVLSFIRTKSSFVKVLVPMTLINGAAIQLPVWFLGAHFGYVEMGAFLIAMRILDAPISFLATPISQFMSSRYVDELSGNREKLRWILCINLGLSVGVYAVFMLLSRFDLSMAFGGQWPLIAEVILWGSIFKAAQFFNLPLAGLLSLTEKKSIGLLIVTVFIPIRWFFMSIFSDDWSVFLVALAMTSVAFYLVFSTVAFALVVKGRSAS